MIVQKFKLPRADWCVTVFYSVTSYYVHEILAELRRAGADEATLNNAYRLLRNCELDTGLTYSNLQTRTSVMVIATTSSAAEFNNSLQHEQRHLERHIADALGIDPNSEDAAYLAGDIAQTMFPYAQTLMCDSCRESLIKSRARPSTGHL